LVAFHRATKNSIAAIWACIADPFVSNPLFSTELPSIRDSPQNHLLANGHGEILNVVTGEFIALVTPGVSFLFGAVPDRALAAVHKLFIGQAATAPNVFCGQGFAIRERAFAGSFPLVEIYQPLLKFDVIVAVCNVNGTDTAIKTTRRNEIRIYRHRFFPPDDLILNLAASINFGLLGLIHFATC